MMTHLLMHPLLMQAIDAEPVVNRAQCSHGELFNCTSSDVCPNNVGQTIPRVWQTSYYNFDNVGNGMLTLFVVATIDNPMDIIGYQTMDSVGVLSFLVIFQSHLSSHLLFLL